MTEGLLVVYGPMSPEQEMWYTREHLPLAGQELSGLVSAVTTGRSPDGSRFALIVPAGEMSVAGLMKTPNMGRVLEDVTSHLPEGSFTATIYTLDR